MVRLRWQINSHGKLPVFKYSSVLLSRPPSKGVAIRRPRWKLTNLKQSYGMTGIEGKINTLSLIFFVAMDAY